MPGGHLPFDDVCQRDCLFGSSEVATEFAGNKGMYDGVRKSDAELDGLGLLAHVASVKRDDVAVSSSSVFAMPINLMDMNIGDSDFDDMVKDLMKELGFDGMDLDDCGESLHSFQSDDENTNPEDCPENAGHQSPLGVDTDFRDVEVETHSPRYVSSAASETVASDTDDLKSDLTTADTDYFSPAEDRSTVVENDSKEPARKKKMSLKSSRPKSRSPLDRVKYLSSFNLFTYLLAWAYRSLSRVKEEKRLDMALKVLEGMPHDERREHAFALCRMTPQEIKKGKKKGEGLQFNTMGLSGRSAWANLSLEEKQRYKDAVEAAKDKYL